jgi:bifunctional non-homologous end joining protein LigD
VAVEAKYDGQRGIATLKNGSVTLLSRNGAIITRTFPEITAALPDAMSGRPVVLDGEIVALDKNGVSSFSRLQRRWPQNRRPSAELLREIPTRFYAFDVLEVDGKDLTRRPYAERRAALTDLDADGSSPIIEFPCHWIDVDPVVVLSAAAEMGLEGIVCKHLDSPYPPGMRLRDWIKTPHRLRSEFVIGGWLAGSGANRHTVGALLLGAYSRDRHLQFCGAVGTGMTSLHRTILDNSRRSARSDKSAKLSLRYSPRRYRPLRRLGNAQTCWGRGISRVPRDTASLFVEGPSSGCVRHRQRGRDRITASIRKVSRWLRQPLPETEELIHH